MRILIDFQAVQASNANRGIGRYSRALVEGMLRNAPQDEFILLLNGMIGENNDILRREFTTAWPNVCVRVWTAAAPVGFLATADRRQAAEAIREAVIADCLPDVVLVSSLFEGLGDDSLTTVGSNPTAVILYDLIPFIFPDIYLTDPNTKRFYENKIAALKRADCLLAISECSARDGIEHLGFPDGQVTNISSDVDAQFAPRVVDGATRDGLAQDFGLIRPFLMYTGGIDHRKNISGLITAFAALPASVIAEHQLAIVCSVNPKEKAGLLAHARAAGLPEDALVMTGYVSDETLVILYNTCAAFVFPSWYEGFGLPVLEAMRCGAAVIGGNVSSVPEVIGCADALFDPKSPADMTRMIKKVLTDGVFRQSLREFAPIQSARFSWDKTALRALTALRDLVRERAAAAPVAALPSRKPSLAFVSPMPPERSGISFYSAELLPALAAHYNIELIVDQETVAATANLPDLPVRDVQWLRDHSLDYDRILYQFGNSHFHAHMFDLLAEIPGVVVLHDFFLSNIERDLNPEEFTCLLGENHGYHAILGRYDMAEGRDGLHEAVQSWPVNARAVKAAKGVIVHSEYSRMLACRFYDKSTVSDWVVIPLVRAFYDLSAQARINARAELGIDQDELLICSFGYLTPSKLPSRLIDGFLGSVSGRNPKVHLVFVGEEGDLGQKLLSRVSSTPLEGRVRITGWVSDDLYRHYMLAADIAIQLRSNSRGESSAAVLDCQNHGLPTIVNAHGSLADLPEHTVLRISDTFTDVELAEAIDRLVSSRDLRADIGAAARELVVTEHNPIACSSAYRDAIETFQRHYREDEHDLILQLAQLPVDPARDIELAQATADSLPSGARLRQLLVDVTELAERDINTGIQRVVRAVLEEWLRDPPPGWRVEPIFADPEQGRYRYARRFTCGFLGVPDSWASDSPIDFYPGDRFVGLDLNPAVGKEMRGTLSAMAASGVGMSFVVYDLLPVLMPQNFSDSATKWFQSWLQTISRYDQLICISRAVADEMCGYLKENPPLNGLMPEIGWFHLGADIENATTKTHLPRVAKMEVECLGKHPRFLMVGTIEPRKGHAFVLDAFEQFWSSSGDATLVIVGKKGWNVDALCARLHEHAENGKRLIWLNTVTDVQLQQLYDTCSCLIAASEGEGFGLPLIEASRQGLPILARDIPVFREVAGEYATYFDAFAPDRLCQALKDWLAADQAGRAPRSEGIRSLTWRESSAALLSSLSIR
ncbi:MAG: glycosyltransferase [Rhodobacterales bacterium]|nr:glycosyltransferase [Rhodobacterales bacterium]